MGSGNRTDRLNSLLREVISEVVRDDVKNPRLSELTTITSVDVSKDIHHAKVHVSVIGNDQERKQTIEALNEAAKYIAAIAMKKVVLRYFPELTFYLDTSADEFARIDSILNKIHDEEKQRNKKHD